MTPPKSNAAPDRKERGPVSYLAFIEADDGRWWLAAADREATSVQKLRAELLDELEAAGHTPSTTRMVLVPTAVANVIEHEREVITKDTFRKGELTRGDASIEPPALMPPASTEAGIAARAAATPAPPGALVDPGDPAGSVVSETPVGGIPSGWDGGSTYSPDDPASQAAQAAAKAETDARRAAVPPVDPDDDEAEFTRNPDIDPATGLSRRTAAQATPADEGRTVFPIEGDV